MSLQRLTVSTLRDRDRLRLSGCCPDVMLAFRRFMRSHMEIYSVELEALKDVVYFTSDDHPSDSQRELVECSVPM